MDAPLAFCLAGSHEQGVGLNATVKPTFKDGTRFFKKPMLSCRQWLCYYSLLQLQPSAFEVAYEM